MFMIRKGKLNRLLMLLLQLALLLFHSIADDPNYKSCGENKECVPRSLCNATAATAGRSILLPLSPSELSEFDCGVLERCCPIENKLAVEQMLEPLISGESES